jgi:hypothetical protein
MVVLFSLQAGEGAATSSGFDPFDGSKSFWGPGMEILDGDPPVIYQLGS